MNDWHNDPLRRNLDLARNHRDGFERGFKWGMLGILLINLLFWAAVFAFGVWAVKQFTS